MSAPIASDKPSKPVRIASWRGPLHFGLLVMSATISLTLQLTYVLLVLALGVWLASKAYGTLGDMARVGILQWSRISELLQMAFLGVTWVLMFRPLRPRRHQVRAALQVTPATQPQLFELIHMLCWHLRAPPPAQVWLDTSNTTRLTMLDGLSGIVTGRTMLRIGLPVISVITSRELSGLMAEVLSYNAGGFSTVFVHAVREMNAWFFRAVMERDEWETGLREDSETESKWCNLRRRMFRGWMWAAKIPFMGFALASRLTSAVTLWVIERSAEKSGANVIGQAAYARMQRKLALLSQARESAEQEIQRGIVQQRLPENLSLLMARHVAKAASEGAAAAAAAGGAKAEAEPPEKPAKGAELVAYLSPSQPAASVIRQFVDLSRQVTYFYYQHDLGLNIHGHRMVAEEEVLHQNRREEDSLRIIRRYFGGLAHPERALCGLGSTPSGSTDCVAMRDDILKVRDEMVAWGPQFKVALQEWNQAWQRRRDLEAAATLSLAGFAVSRMQFGTEDSSPGALRTEASKQRMVMEHMEGPLQERERALERRFASALGILWWSDAGDLGDWLSGRRRDLASWVTVYEAMAGALPSFRELLTTFFAFQTLGAKFANVDDPSAFLTALQSVVPKMLNLVRQIASTMDGAPYPFSQGGGRKSLNEHLLPSGLPELPGVSMTSMDASNMKSMGLKMASDASECIAPYIDTFLGLYHRAFAWLAESAERTETHFIGALGMGSSTEILLPDEFTSRRLGMKDKSPDEIVAWKRPV